MTVKYKFARQNGKKRQKSECENERDIFGLKSVGGHILDQIFQEIVAKNEDEKQEYAGYLAQNLLQQGGNLQNFIPTFVYFYKLKYREHLH